MLFVFTAWFKKNIPVRHERVFLAPKHDADVGGVVNGRVEVRVVANVSWQVHLGLALFDERSENKNPFY